MSKAEFKPGFRVLPHDIPFIVIGIALAVYFYSSIPDLSVIAITSVFHFFLFCNIFRIRRAPELIWGGIFITLSYLKIEGLIQNWSLSLLISFIIAICIIAYETKHPSYHGVFWRKLNPNLKNWWTALHQKN